MSTISLRLPDSLHRQVRELAKQDGISINQFAATAVAEKAIRPARQQLSGTLPALDPFII